MRQTACLVFNLVMVDNYAAFFKCTPVGRASDSGVRCSWISIVEQPTESVESSFLIHQGGYHDLFVCP